MDEIGVKTGGNQGNNGNLILVRHAPRVPVSNTFLFNVRHFLLKQVLMLDKLVERGKTMAVLFYDPNDNQDLDIMDELEKIDDECRRFEIDFVKVQIEKELHVFNQFL